MSETTQFSLDFLPERKVYSVSELAEAIRNTLEGEFRDVWLQGEISNFKLAPSGHLYFTLKDEEAQLRCVFFRQSARLLRFKPDDGLAVVARGRVSVWEPRGELQLLVEHMEPRGLGALQLAFEQLKKKLAAEGLFDQARKRSLPVFPRRIGIVTSPRGAVISDMLRILHRRFAGLHIVLYPVRVQGEGAAGDLCRAIGYFSRTKTVDLVIVGRGGGSLEDLWPFNEESVARAISACSVPVISAVGHETDVTIADFVADLRAPTPSAAAELAIRAKAEFAELIHACQERLGRAVRYRAAVLRRRLTDVGVERAVGLLRRRLDRSSQRNDELDFGLRDRMRRRLLDAERRLGAAADRLRSRDVRLELGKRRARLEQLQATFEQRVRLKLALLSGRTESLRAQLAHLSPLAVLERGYAIAQDENGKLLRRSSETAPGRRVRIRLHQGRLGAEVREVE